MMKKIIAITVAAVLLLGGGVAAASAIAAANKPVLPANFYINFDGSSLDVPETASVIHVEKVIFDPEETAEALLRHKDAEYSFVGPGAVWHSWADDDIDEFLQVFYDGRYMDANRTPTGAIRYKWNPYMNDSSSLPERLSVSISTNCDGHSEPNDFALRRYIGTDDFDNLTFADAKNTIDSALEAIGMPMENLVNTQVLRLSPEDQDQYLKDENAEWIAGGALLGYEFEPIYQSPESLDVFKNSFVFEYRQIFDGIPVSKLAWTDAARSGREHQRIAACVSADGSYSFEACNVYKEVSREEAQTLVTYKEALEQLVALFEDSDLRFEHHLIDAELYYSIGKDTLYPMWVFTVLDDHELSYTGYIGDDTYIDTDALFYVFDGFTGEFVEASRGALSN